MMKEQNIQKTIIDFLRWNKFLVIKINNVGIRKPDGSYIPPAQKGISDLIACKHGRFFAIEIKARNRSLTLYQKEFLDEVVNAGGVSFVAQSIEDVREAIPDLVN